MAHFILKTEPSTYSIDDLKHEKVTSWTGVRNYQARNTMRSMKKGDVCIIYHSSCAVPAAVGLAIVTKEAYPDPLQFDRHSEYFDAASKINDPRWSTIDLRFSEKFGREVTLEMMKCMKELRSCKLLARGNRLSVLPVTDEEFDAIMTASS
jgi:predicted RNA-binding protein with PUA-like domain